MPLVRQKGVIVNSENKTDLKKAGRERLKSEGKAKKQKIKQNASSSPTKKLTTYDFFCPTCSEGVGDGPEDEPSIQCDRCEVWVHLGCSGMGDAEKENVKENKFDVLKYFCPKCLEDICSGENQQETKLNNVIEIVRLLQEQQGVLQEQNKEILEKLKEEKEKPNLSPVVWPKVESNITSSITEVLNEQKEIEDKKLDLILFNVPESKKKPDGTDNNEEDQGKVSDIITYLHPEVRPSEIEPATIRLGRRREGPEERPRPIKIEVNFLETKERMLKNARLLRDYRIPKIGISHNKTKKEMEEDRKLKGELNKRREAEPTKEFQIYNKTVMTREEAKILKDEKERMYNERQLARARVLNNMKEGDKDNSEQGESPGGQA